eukprot:288418-Pelagomonas_calceolata.AAC.2
MGSKGLWLALISQFDYPIRIRAARAAAAAAGLLLLLGGSSVQELSYTREGATQEGNLHPHWNVHSKHNTGRTHAHKRTS